MELRAQYQLQLDKKEEAEKSYRALLARNNEYRLYYEQLEQALGFDRTRDVDKLIELYKTLAAENDRVDAPLRIPLDFLQGMNYIHVVSLYPLMI
jgi:peptide alpha-N-acetyltransferase